MIEVGFWRRFQDQTIDSLDKRPWPNVETTSAMISDEQLRQRRRIAERIASYCRAGFLESIEHGYAACRLCSEGGKKIGCCALTDGVFVWPESLPHYLLEHFAPDPSEEGGSELCETKSEDNLDADELADWLLPFPPAFLRRALDTERLEALRYLRSKVAGETCDGMPVVLKWEAIEGKPVTATRSEVEWIREHTLLLSGAKDAARRGAMSCCSYDCCFYRWGKCSPISYWEWFLRIPCQ